MAELGRHEITLFCLRPGFTGAALELRDALLDVVEAVRPVGEPGRKLEVNRTELACCCLAIYFTADLSGYFVTLGERSLG